MLLFLTLAISPADLHYVRPMGDSFVLESHITWEKSATGAEYVSVTQRPDTKLTLRLQLDGQSAPLSGTVAVENRARTSATLNLTAGKAVVRRNDAGVQELPAKNIVVVTSAPDWSDIILLIPRYDVKKGGRQEFNGIWFHPVQEARLLTFEVEKLGMDKVVHEGNERRLDRYRVRLRSGDYVVWADEAGLVYKLMPSGRPQNAVILRGFEESTAKLR